MKVTSSDVLYIGHLDPASLEGMLRMLCVDLFNRITQMKIRLFRKSNFSFLFLFTLFRFADYRQLAVNIFCDVGGEELHQVEALFGLQASLLQDGGEIKPAF